MKETLEALYLVNKKAHQLKLKSSKSSKVYFELKKKAVLKLWLEGHLIVGDIHEPDLVWFESVYQNGKYNFHQQDEYEIMQNFGKPKKWGKDSQSTEIDKEKCKCFLPEDQRGAAFKGKLTPNIKRATTLITSYTDQFDFDVEKKKLKDSVREEICDYIEGANKNEILNSTFTEKDLMDSISQFPPTQKYLNLMEVFYTKYKNQVDAYDLKQKLEINFPTVKAGKISW
ncbi:TPA: hypothetical protein ACG05V_005307 [Bacillus pacificus]|uniref:hypothetical protein n=1 Tax=Bacillus cereus group TaxID=86661 RepID=UPI00027CD698|nr:MULTISPECIES: hypothetical protein [unclassified Bacillus cereus group]AFQ13098.1 hypothetical protein BCK_26443 [Bacillus cereus FRI-35]